ncbi:MAG: hypothetical protein DWQ19_08985 [Crenarchaeota archaeon]|nr:MAG: hypothetical protein DWQ19_08985 [Thermoproteota archaeon]
MITIITTFRSFEDPLFSTIQQNAIYSWLQLTPKPEIIVFGNDHPGTNEICKEYNLIHVPDIACTENKTPLGNAVVEEGEKLSKNKIIAWISSDIIVPQKLIEVAQKIYKQLPTFFAGARRHDCKVNELIFGNYEQLKTKPGHPGAGDIFLWSNGFFQDKNMPPFAVGRTIMDSWMIYTAIKHNCCVDITDSCYCIHQTHDPNPRNKTGAWNQRDYKDYEENQRLWKESEAYKNPNVEIKYANYIFSQNVLKRKRKSSNKPKIL